MDFIDAQYIHVLITLLIAINTFLEKPEYETPKFNVDETIIIDISNALATGTYDPAQWFYPKKNTNPEVSLNRDLPELDDQRDYTILCLNAGDKNSQTRSMPTGGIIYEDPFYALLACFNIGKFKELLVIPKVYDFSTTWKQRDTIIKLLKEGTYNPIQFFDKGVLRSIESPPGLPVRLLTIEGFNLKKVRYMGFSSISIKQKGAAVFTLYTFIPPDNVLEKTVNTKDDEIE